jgi:hypothetical protein
MLDFPLPLAHTYQPHGRLAQQACCDLRGLRGRLQRANQYWLPRRYRSDLESSITKLVPAPKLRTERALPVTPYRTQEINSMPRTTHLFRSSRYRGLLRFVMVASAFVVPPALQAASPIPLGVIVTVVGQQTIDPAKVVGHSECVECHKSEAAAWQLSSHATKSFKLLTENPKSKEIAAKMSVSMASLTTNSVCTTCHGTQQQVGGQTLALGGNSCEACHGASGPKAGGWFSVHSNLGNDNKDRTKESEEHFKKRIADCNQLGMNRSENTYELAKNCYQCHAVPLEQVVNQAGHPSGRAAFELVEYSQGEVRHNFQLNQRVNAEAPTLWTDPLWHGGANRSAEGRRRMMYVVGQLVDLEVSLRNRGSATARGTYASALQMRINAARGKLEKIDALISVPEVKLALAALKPISRADLLIVNAAKKPVFDAAADQIAAAARALAVRNVGNELAAIDEMLPKTTVGKPYSP